MCVPVYHVVHAKNMQEQQLKNEQQNLGLKTVRNVDRYLAAFKLGFTLKFTTFLHRVPCDFFFFCS